LDRRPEDEEEGGGGGGEDGPDLEALLEEFREPEAPKRKKGSPLWLGLAVIASVLGCWLAARATSGAGLLPKVEMPVPMKPSKVADREAIAAAKGPANVAADYKERCLKGMTVQEVSWVLEDFRKTGLESSPPVSGAGTFEDGLSGPGLSDLAGTQRAWYRHTLGEALSLDRDQKREMTERSRALLKAELEETGGLIEQLQKDRENAILSPVGPGDPPPAEASLEAELIDVSRWMSEERYAPANLCHLREDQILSGSGETPGKIKDARVPEKTELPDPVPGVAPPSLEDDGKEHEDPVLQDGWERVAAILPFRAEQLPLRQNSDTASAVHGLHPSQLKLFLLLEPGLAEEIVEAMEQKDE